MKGEFFKSSKDPVALIESMTYPGQPAHYRMYHTGYESNFERLPKLDINDPNFATNMAIAGAVMNELGDQLLQEDPYIHQLRPNRNGFYRSILAVEDRPIISDKKSSEVVLGGWGDGFTTTAHGHAAGFHFEKLLYGKIKADSYRITDQEKRIVRPTETQIYTGSKEISIGYYEESGYPLSSKIHNLTSIGNSVSLHFFPDHTRDGRNNGFEVEYFEQEHLLNPEMFVQLNHIEAAEGLQIGDIALVRSENVPDYGDHWMIITGPPIMKPHGLRHQDTAISAPHAADTLEKFHPINGLRLLKLNNEQLKEKFLKFHDIKIDGDKIIFPTAS